MSAVALLAGLGRRWFGILALGSVAFVCITFVAFATENTGRLSMLLFWLGLAGENNVGAWWSGALLFVAAVFALDGTVAGKPGAERKGWLALAGVLLVLSFDEVASLHEYLDSIDRAYLGIFALALFVAMVYAAWQFLRSGLDRRTLWLLALAFALLGTVPIQEIIQHSREWPSSVIYGVRGAVEEGTELAGILLLVLASSRNPRLLIGTPGGEPIEIANHRRPLLYAAIALAPLLVIGTFFLPYPGGPANWLASVCYLSGAMLVLRRLLRLRPAAPAAVVLLFAWYLAASLGSTAIRHDWDPIVLGTAVNLRGVFIALLLAVGLPILRSAGRRARPLVLGGIALAALVAALWWPESQALWCALPIIPAVYVYAVESALGAQRPLPRAEAHGPKVMSGDPKTV